MLENTFCLVLLQTLLSFKKKIFLPNYVGFTGLTSNRLRLSEFLPRTKHFPAVKLPFSMHFQKSPCFAIPSA